MTQPKGTNMTEQEKAKWRHRAELKKRLLFHGHNHLSGTDLNEVVGLPPDAVWKEENFA